MPWTKLDKVVETTGGAGFLNDPGFLVDGFLSDIGGFWVKIDDTTGTWVNITKVEE
jgi:hypothetical protein